jgi:ABC-type Fe3+ transport system permease subunit
MERNMETSAAQIAQQNRHHSHRRSGKRHQSRRKRTKKILQRLAILLFLLVVMLAFLYVWVSSGSSESTGQLLRSPSAKVEVGISSDLS